jgi:transcriptional regulator with XRE-family HTH domain
MKSISERIIEGMSIRNMKQVDIIEATGINKGSLSSYISGKYEPKQTNIYKIAKALDVNEAWLMGHDVPMERKSKNSKYSPSVIDTSNTTSYTEQNLLNKYRSLDDKGKHTVDTVLEMEYNRYNTSDISKVVKINSGDDRSHLIPLASHERTDIEVTEEMKKHDDTFFGE